MLTNIETNLKQNFFVLAYLLLFPAAASAGASLFEIDKFAAQKAVEISLQHMNYTDILVEGCNLTFSRNVQPTTENNGFHKYTRIVELSVLSGRSELTWRNIKDGFGFYELIMSTTKAYSKRSLAVDAYLLNLRDEYPESNVPYINPWLYDEFSPAVEARLREFLGDAEGLIIWQNFSKFGRHTHVLPRFVVSYGDEESLRSFENAPQRYIIDNNC